MKEEGPWINVRGVGYSEGVGIEEVKAGERIGALAPAYPVLR